MFGSYLHWDHGRSGGPASALGSINDINGDMSSYLLVPHFLGINIHKPSMT